MESFGISAGAGPCDFSAGPRWVDGPAAARRSRVVRPLGSAARPRPRSGVRLTRRGRGVLIVLALLLAAVATVLAASG